jgi:hypothetical protein
MLTSGVNLFIVTDTKILGKEKCHEARRIDICRYFKRSARDALPRPPRASRKGAEGGGARGIYPIEESRSFAGSSPVEYATSSKGQEFVIHECLVSAWFA